MVDGQWGATMVLTEPDAGSDVGAGRTKAIQQADGTWHIEGVKRFITSAEHDMSENIVHLVLARPEGAGPGTKGLSLFIVPEVPLRLGDRRAGRAQRRLRHQRRAQDGPEGLHHLRAHLRRAASRPSAGWSARCTTASRQMFKVIEFARMMVGTKAIATLSTGYLNALDYAKTRAPGRRTSTQMTDKAAPRVPITHHPDVRRSLMTAEGVRRGHARARPLHRDHPGRGRPGRGGRRRRATRTTSPCGLNDLLLPIVKGYGSEQSYELLGSQSLQTFGGSGYLQDYPIEQYIRDAKIDTLYEGTTAIQGMDFFFRKIVRDKGQALTKLMTEIQEFAKGDEGNGALRAERDAARHRRSSDVQGIVGTMVGSLTASRRRTSPTSTRSARTPPGCCWPAATSWSAGCCCARPAVALAALEAGATGRDKAFYRARWPRRSSSPPRCCRCITAARAVAEASTTP